MLELTDGEFEQGSWERHRIPKSRQSIYLPTSFDEYWDDCVETVASALAEDDGSSAFGWVRRQEICRSGNVWFIVDSDDRGELDITIIGQFDTPEEGSWRCLCASDAFLCGPGRAPVALEEETEELDWETEPIETLVEDDLMWARVLEQLRTLSVVTEHGVELVGRNAASALPGGGDWWLLPMSPADAGDLVQAGTDAWAVTFSVRGLTTHAVAAPLSSGAGLALAQAHGLREAVVLTQPSIYLVDVPFGSCATEVNRDLSDLPAC